MRNIYGFKGRKPIIGVDVYIDPMSRVIGDVEIGDYSVILFGSIIRGDDDRILIGRRVAILEHCIVEAPKGNPVYVGDETLISHGAIVHGAKVGKNVLVGIGAIILDGSNIGDNSIIAAGSLVPPGKDIPPNSIAMGIPAKVVREVTENDLEMVKGELEAVLEKSRYYRMLFK